MCQPVAGPFYRAAGLSYLRYANICADIMRSVMKEPFKTKALQRQTISFRSAVWSDGKHGPSGASDPATCRFAPSRNSHGNPCCSMAGHLIAEVLDTAADACCCIPHISHAASLAFERDSAHPASLACLYCLLQW
eukprot:GHUV01040561.1.p1 GENE.GHUV01040561.1~~GHUV01040561.1.p1  ORF type:complete len:135 (-),score=15.06 GHUV01040561.1:749-1153(-)